MSSSSSDNAEEAKKGTTTTSSSSSSEEDEEKKEKKRRLKELKELKPPKRPLRANNFYIKSNYRRMANDVGAFAKASDVLNRLNEEWMRLNAEAKKPYLDRAQQDRDRYFNELHLYRARYALLKDDPRARPPKRKFKQTNYPRRPLSVMQCYIREQYPNRQRAAPNSTRRQLINDIKQDWIHLPDAARENYKKLHETDKKRYERQVQDYIDRQANMEMELRIRAQEKRRRREAAELRKQQWFPWIWSNCNQQ